jgi:GT2 family glycosyltransferase
MGQSFDIKNAAFFCVAIPKATLEKCGLISEDYGQGFFEDDDYCRLIESKKLRVVCAEDVFIHHELSASFNKLPDAHKKKLFDTNKSIYEKKWGKWVPHQHRD